MGNQEEKKKRADDGSGGARVKARKSARPDKIAYVPINDEDLAPYEPPVKNKHKA